MCYVPVLLKNSLGYSPVAIDSAEDWLISTWLATLADCTEYKVFTTKRWQLHSGFGCNKTKDEQRAALKALICSQQASARVYLNTAAAACVRFRTSHRREALRRDQLAASVLKRSDWLVWMWQTYDFFQSPSRFFKGARSLRTLSVGSLSDKNIWNKSLG